MSFKFIISLNYVLQLLPFQVLDLVVVSAYPVIVIQWNYTIFLFSEVCVLLYLYNTIYISRHMIIFSNTDIIWVQLSVLNMAGVELKLCSTAEE